MQTVCSLTARVHYLNQILSRVTTSNRGCYFYIDIFDGKLEIFQPERDMKSYFTITDKHLTSIDVYQDEPVSVVIESEKLHDEINNITPKKVTIQVKKSPQEAIATKVTVRDPKYTRSMSIDLNFSINWDNMAKAVVNHHGINPDKISNVDSRKDAAEKIFQELIKFEQENKLKIIQ